MSPIVPVTLLSVRHPERSSPHNMRRTQSNEPLYFAFAFVFRLESKSMLARLRAFFNPHDERTLLRRIFWVAFLVRLLYMTLAHTYRIRISEGSFQFGWEAGRIARALVTGYGYSDPFANAFVAHTGPTAWLPPLYPLLLAAIFRVFGVYTLASAWVLLTIQSAFSAATALATWEIAARCFSRRVALWLRVALGALSRRHAVRRPLALGDDHHHRPLRLHPRPRPPHERS